MTSPIEPKAGRKVRIELLHGSWFVLYVSRRKHQRYSAATFDAKDHNKNKVVEWIKNNPNLELME